jgi:hypothetical protein
MRACHHDVGVPGFRRKSACRVADGLGDGDQGRQAAGRVESLAIKGRVELVCELRGRGCQHRVPDSYSARKGRSVTRLRVPLGDLSRVSWSCPAWSSGPALVPSGSGRGGR